MTAISAEFDNNRTTTVTTALTTIATTRHLEATTMPTILRIRHPDGHRLPYPRPTPTVSLDPRPVIIPILSSVIGFPIVVFALICALRHRAIKLRRRDQLKKLQAGIRSVTLDIPPREKVSFFSGCSSPDMSIKEMGERLESFTLKSSLASSSLKKSSSKNNNHVTFVTPPSSAIGVSALTAVAAAATATCAPKPCNSAAPSVVEVLLHVNSAAHVNSRSNSPALSNRKLDIEQDYSSNESSR